MRILIAVAAFALMSSPALAAPCKDAKGKFIKCPPKTAPAAAPVAAKPAMAKAAPCKDAKGKFMKCGTTPAAPMAMAGGVTKDAKGKCHVASGPKKGQFTTCPK